MTTTTLELISNGDSLDISDETNFLHEHHDGFGMPPLHRITERGPLQHGETDLGFRLDPLVINLVIPLIASSWDTHYDRRASLLAKLRPSNTAMQLRFTLPNGDKRQIDCYCIAGPIFSTQDQIAMGYNWRAAFALKAPNPTWYDPDGDALTMNLGGGADTWEVPYSVPYTVGGTSVDKSSAINYGGTWDSYPNLIRITGPITDPVVTNTTLDLKLDFTGTTISAGHYYDIDLRYGYKTVLDDAGTNVLANLTSDSDLAEWRIASAPTASSGVNSINVTGSSITAASQVDISYYTRYLGVHNAI